VNDANEQKVPNKNAQVIIPLAIIAWLGGIPVFAVGVPPVVEALFVVAFFMKRCQACFYALVLE
jgi:hypothetical protein